MPATLWLALATVSVAVYTDLRGRRIPNWLTGGLALAALVLQARAGVPELLVALATMVATFVLGTLVFARGWLGGGDVKLIAAVSAALAWPDTLAFVLYTALGGGVLALGVSAAGGRLRGTLRSAFHLALPLVQPGAIAIEPRDGVKLPYAIAIAFGTLCVALIHTYAPVLRLAL